MSEQTRTKSIQHGHRRDGNNRSRDEANQPKQSPKPPLTRGRTLRAATTDAQPNAHEPPRRGDLTARPRLSGRCGMVRFASATCPLIPPISVTPEQANTPTRAAHGPRDRDTDRARSPVTMDGLTYTATRDSHLYAVQWKNPKQKPQVTASESWGFYRAAFGIRTRDLRITSALLWPTELRRHAVCTMVRPAATPSLHSFEGWSVHGPLAGLWAGQEHFLWAAGGVPSRR